MLRLALNFHTSARTYKGINKFFCKFKHSHSCFKTASTSSNYIQGKATTNYWSRSLYTGANVLQSSTNEGKKEVIESTKTREEIPQNVNKVQKSKWKWDRRVKIGTGLMIAWVFISAAVMIYGNNIMKDKQHERLLEQSLKYMSDEDKAKMEALFEAEARNPRK